MIRAGRDALLALAATPDPSTAEGRARDRLRRIVLSVGASGASRVVTIAAMLVTVPMTLHYLGQERFGIWAVISSFSVMLAFADMGLGNGVLNAVAKAHGAGDRAAIRTTVASGYVMLGLLATVLLVGFMLAYPHLDWARVFNVRSAQARAEAGPAIAAFVVLFACTIPATLIQKIQFGLQQGFVNSAWQCVGSLVTLLGLIAAVLAGASLPWLVVALLSGPLLASLLNTLVFFRGSGRDLRPAIRLADGAVMRATLGAGLMFFTLQLLASLAFGADPIIITQVLGASAVADYAVPDRLFSIIPMALNMMLAPLWPAYGEAVARGDHDWVRTALFRTTAAAMAGALLLAVIFVAGGPAILHLWVGPQIDPGFALLAALGAWKVVEAINGTLAVYMNGTGMLKIQTAIALVSCTTMILLKIALAKVLGVIGIPLAALLAAVPLGTVPIVWAILHRLNARRDEPAFP